MNRLEDKNKRAVIASEDNQEIETAPEPPQDLHDSWRVWFDHAAEKPTVEDAPTINSDRVEEDQKEREEVLGLQMEEDEITVPLRVVSHYASNAESFVSDAVQQEQPGYLDGSKQHIGNKFLFSIQLAMIFLSTVVLVLALIGSGYLDTYLVSNIQVESISDIRMFIK